MSIKSISLSFSKNQSELAQALVTLKSGNTFLANVKKNLNGIGFYVTLGGAIDAYSPLFDEIRLAVRREYMLSV